MKTKFYILLLTIGLLVGSCGRTANSDGTRAEVVPAPLAGYTCFVIIDGEGKAVGGNCIKN